MKRFIPYHSVLVMFAALSIGGCDQSTNGSYFPLGGDIGWEYRIGYQVKGEQRTQRLIFSNRPSVEVDGERYYPRISLSDHRDYYQKDDKGIVHVDPVSGDRTRLLAYPIEKGQQWQADSRIQFLEVTGAFAATFNTRITQPITLDYAIEETGETVTVPAGEFDNCIRVKSKGRLYGGRRLQEYMGIDSIYIEQTQWYAPGTGLIKTVREEYTAPNEFSNTYTQELLSLARG